jgi:hypothetical protein
MDILTPLSPLARMAFIATIALVSTLIGASGAEAVDGPDARSEVTVKAAFLYNFAKFAEWPTLQPGAPIAVCIIGDDAVATAFSRTVHGLNISGHALDVSEPSDGAAWSGCHLLFIADGDMQRAATGLSALKTLPVLTVSDAKGFSRTDGIIELYVEDGRMRFAINVDAAERSGLHLSSRLLGLARLVRSNRGQ